MRKRWRWRRGEGRYNIVGCFESRPLKHHNISSSVDSVRKEQKKTAIICSRKKSKKSVRIKYSQLENQLEAEQKNWSWFMMLVPHLSLHLCSLSVMWFICVCDFNPDDLVPV